MSAAGVLLLATTVAEEAVHQEGIYLKYNMLRSC